MYRAGELELSASCKVGGMVDGGFNVVWMPVVLRTR